MSPLDPTVPLPPQLTPTNLDGPQVQLCVCALARTVECSATAGTERNVNRTDGQRSQTCSVKTIENVSNIQMFEIKCQIIQPKRLDQSG